MSEAKTSRLLNLLIALLHTELGISRERILRDVYGHTAPAGDGGEADSETEAVLRKFERDKADLRSMGAVIIEELGYERMESDEEVAKYRIDPAGFRLPPQRFSAEESTWLALAALACDDAVAGADAQRALRRLEAAGALPETPPSQVQPRVRLDTHWVTLTDAAARGAEVTFDYHATSTGETRRRRVQPWGLGQRYGQWYLAGNDEDRGGLRVFRLSRIRGTVAVGEPGSFEPAGEGAVREALDGFDALAERRASLLVAEDRALDLRRHWEPAGAGPPGWDAGEYAFRDASVAAERLAGFGDAVKVLGPEDLVAEVLGRLRGAREAIGSAGAAETPGQKPVRRMTTGQERLERLMDLVPFLLSGPVTVQEIADEFGLTRKAVLRELELLRDAGPIDSAGFQSYIEISVDEDVVTVANAEELSRPRRLSPGEAVALQLGLKALLPLADTASAEAILRLADRVGAAAVEGGRALPEVDLRSEPQHNAELVPVLAEAAVAGRTLRLRYLNPTKDEVTERLINPLGVFSDADRWYVNSYCHRAGDRRVFRIDRIEAVEAAEPLPLPEGFEPGDGALFMRRASDLEVTVRLAPEARWAEASFDAHDGRDLEDGSRRVLLTVLDLAWLPSFLAQFGGAAALEGPAEAVEAARSWFDRALALYGAAAPTR
ncbi:WYL domain-containing protein [Sinomonas atrocyanea]|uniref:helix-turn-helix transcriptional regulator n=1 Tax=Sinomonas atrocyanea TaxID=37927 RepID=UPI00082E6FC1|nr:WYL domain-containing protein [Sinomonas atrocyanea]GEB62752.1 WYL domain-containing protein [Sinomonas atrocyanea]GGG62278.1 WYL domain-containing protein [Sinomonas atrocyanea]